MDFAFACGLGPAGGSWRGGGPRAGAASQLELACPGECASPDDRGFAIGGRTAGRHPASAGTVSGGRRGGSACSGKAGVTVRPTWGVGSSGRLRVWTGRRECGRPEPGPAPAAGSVEDAITSLARGSGHRRGRATVDPRSQDSRGTGGHGGDAQVGGRDAAVIRALRRSLWIAGWPARTILLLAIRGYRLGFSGLLGGQCRFHPSCSVYAEKAISEAGAAQGAMLAMWRVLRCSPLSRGGVDHPPIRTRGRRESDGPVYDAIIRPGSSDASAPAAEVAAR
jgi:putative membrane protein insertion efficiency factor